MRFKISEIQPNPFRHMDRYPIRRDKVAALRESLRSTGFWDNVVARINGDGRPQIAYGHHRLVALREEYPASHQVDLIVRELPDDQMLKIMARENMEEWGSSAAVEHETVRAVVEAYAEDLIELETPDPSARQTQLRSAPSFVMGDVRAPGHARHSYTSETVARFLGWDDTKVKYALGALELIELHDATEEQFNDLGTKAARALVEQIRGAKRAAEIRAKEQQKKAVEAEKAAREAERRRATAAKEADKRRAEAKRAQEKAAQERAIRQAREADARAHAAERQRQEAERNRGRAREREASERAEAHKRAKVTGQHVSAGLKSGRGYANASAIADEVRPQRGTTPPPQIDDAAMKLAAKLNRILVPEMDVRALDLQNLLRWRDYLSPAAQSELATVLDQIIGRATKFKQQLKAVNKGAVVDGEVIETEALALSAGRK
jgi:hypothetical protein